MPPLPHTVRQQVRQRAHYRCEYCQTDEQLTGIPNHIDHIIPLALGGTDLPDNLCLACASCNSHKWANIEGLDPSSGTRVPLFNPRQQTWTEQFMWSQDGQQIIGLTACGRVTIATLQMNHVLVVTARRLWVQFGLHPPSRAGV